MNKNKNECSLDIKKLLLQQDKEELEYIECHLNTLESIYRRYLFKPSARQLRDSIVEIKGIYAKKKGIYESRVKDN